MMKAEHPRWLTLRERMQICRCLSGLRLPCGCVAGRYLTYSDDEITVIDHAGRLCAVHRVDSVIAESRAGAVR